MAEESIDQLTVGDRAPSFELPGTDGEEYSLESFDGNEAVLVVFTCNHCPYAQAKHDLLNDIASSEDVAVVGINPNDAESYPDDSFETMVELVEDGTIAYDAYLHDESQEVATAYGAVCTPDPFLLAAEDGEFRLAYHGQLDDALNPDDEPTRYHVREAIEAVRAGEDVEVEGGPSRGCSIKWRDGNEPAYWDDL